MLCCRVRLTHNLAVFCSNATLIHPKPYEARITGKSDVFMLYSDLLPILISYVNLPTYFCPF